ncbi:MAG: ATP-binding cassette domain-containing protein [Candidatus Saccharibacteria bacterium]|nr:ATP-binding cassette domain-containing protein [Candidatus Saccharibacteria bacterium]
MILDVHITSKSFGANELYSGLDLSLNRGEKVGLIGRNGVGKTTLLDIISGVDTDFAGEVYIKKGLTLISSRQEHHEHSDLTMLEYVLGDLPEFTKLKHILDTYPAVMGEQPRKMHIYGEALERFMTLGYFEIENTIQSYLDAYQLPRDIFDRKISSLSGGQLRLVELIKVQVASAHIILIDEPTNHMDYIAKASFIKWLKAANEAMLIITHDRDVLMHVDRIVEIRDGEAVNYIGNYDQYLKINTDRMSGAVNEYQIAKSRIVNLEADLIRFRRLKEKSRTPGTIRRFKSLEQRTVKELAELKEQDKPSFWIDQDSVKDLSTKLKNAYSEHKSATIRLNLPKQEDVERRLLKVNALSLGYDAPLFQPVNFELYSNTRLQLRGRNGAGKTTLVTALIDTLNGQQLRSKVSGGQIEISYQASVGVYKQTFEERYLEMTLHDAIEHVYRDNDLPITDQKIRGLLDDYLFDANSDGSKIVRVLSGGQKARFQLIAMLANRPQILFLDEPTNHLDLPSIEELELALQQYHGAIVYVSHDSRFSEAIGGKIVDLAL